MFCIVLHSLFLKTSFHSFCATWSTSEIFDILECKGCENLVPLMKHFVQKFSSTLNSFSPICVDHCPGPSLCSVFYGCSATHWFSWESQNNSQMILLTALCVISRTQNVYPGCQFWLIRRLVCARLFLLLPYPTFSAPKKEVSAYISLWVSSHPKIPRCFLKQVYVINCSRLNAIIITLVWPFLV